MDIRHLLSYSLVLFGVCLFIVGTNSQTEDVPLSKLSQNVGAPTLKILYCYSCGYKKMFEQYASILNQKYPYILVDGANYDPPGMNMFIARAIGFLKTIAILCILLGVNIFEYINQPRPSWWIWCTENKIYACMMLFFLSNVIEGQLVQSGAFEMTLNDVPVWSKLETGRIPQPAELFQIIDSHMQFDTKIELDGYTK
ncbi:unnamed protein product [Acanthoscelides obtectus]|uniref:Thioredoxin reductase-like selenoprotein T homolog CG3887 n=1 Tax=Acanthoscelides obtectus TaxID=200917 RepID=A0A9P0NSF1_ACAOB|nr:unnamed protein product [Acanthoscelides obtectus]CAK1642973.1 Thioredoxin reductase-like selenoprotein T homolog CG3887 [Acanthoscelides obtectus]